MATKTQKKTGGHPTPTGKYVEAVGSRKRAVARIRLFENTKAAHSTIIVNGSDSETYFPTEVTRLIAHDSLQKVKAGHYIVSARVAGGGFNAQAEAVRHGISRALVKIDEDFRKKLKKSGFLKRDPREKERRKFGLKKARKAPQWSKR